MTKGWVRATSRSYILLAPAFVPLRYPIRAWSWLRSWIAGGSRENSSLLVSDRTEYTRAALLIRTCNLFALAHFLTRPLLSAFLLLSPFLCHHDRAFRFSPLFYYALYHLLFYEHRSSSILNTPLLSASLAIYHFWIAIFWGICDYIYSLEDFRKIQDKIVKDIR